MKLLTGHESLLSGIALPWLRGQVHTYDWKHWPFFAINLFCSVPSWSKPYPAWCPVTQGQHWQLPLLQDHTLYMEEVWQPCPPDATGEMRTTRTAKWKLGIIWSSPTLLVGDAKNSMKFSSAFICKQPYQDTGLAKQTPKKCTFSVCFGERRSIFILRLCPFSRNGLTDRHAWLSPWHLCTTTWWQVFYLFLKFDIYL